MAQNDQAAGLDVMSDPTQTLDKQLPELTQPAAAVGGIPAYQPAPATPVPQEPAVKPGSFGAKLANALKGFQAAIGDTGAIGQVPEGAGALYGIQKTMQAAQARQKQEQEHKEVLEQQARENTREDWRVMANVATANAQMRHEQALTYQLGQEQIDKSIASGSQMADQWKSLPKAQSQVLGENLTASEISNMLKQKDSDGKPKLDPTRSTAFPTGKKIVNYDSQGTPQYAMTYTLMSIPAEYQLSKEDQDWVNVVNKIPGGHQYNIQYDGADNKSDRMPGYVANSLYKQAQAIQAAAVDAAQTKKTQGLNLEAAALVGDPNNPWIKSRAAFPDDLNQAMTHMMADPNVRKQYPNIERDVRMTYADDKDDPNGVKGWEKALKEEEIERNAQAVRDETARHHKEDEDIARLNAKNKAAKDADYQGDENLLDKYIQSNNPADKADYFKSFSGTERYNIANIGLGQTDVGNAAYLLARKPKLLAAVNLFFPDYSGVEVKGFGDAVKSFSPGGKDARRMQAADTVLKHMYELDKDTTDWSRLPGSEEKKKRTADYEALKGELSIYIAGGNAATKDSDASAEAAMGGNNMLSLNRQAAYKQVQKLLTEGLSSQSQAWQNAVPEIYKYDMPYKLSPQAQSSLLLTQNNGKVTFNIQGRPVTFSDRDKLAAVLQAKQDFDRKQLKAQHAKVVDDFVRTAALPQSMPGQPAAGELPAGVSNPVEK